MDNNNLEQQQELGRVVSTMEEREWIRQRYTNLLGQDMPKTIAVKELIDNAMDQCNTGRAKKTYFDVGLNHAYVWDNGFGISTQIDENDEKKRPSLLISAVEMRSSTNLHNDGDSENTVGANGVGMKLSNYISKKFFVHRHKEDKGFIFSEGVNIFGKNDIELRECPDLPEEIKQLNSKEPAERGFSVCAEYDNDFIDEEINIEYLKQYALYRLAEMNNKNIHMVFNGEEFHSKDMLSWSDKVKEFKKDHNVVQTIEYWDENNKTGKIYFAFSLEDTKIKCMCNYAPIENKTTIKVPVKLGDIYQYVPIGATFWIQAFSVKYDQTKTQVPVRSMNNRIIDAVMKSKLWSEIKEQAELLYLKSQNKTGKAEANIYWPSLGGKGIEEELIICEGYSPISNIKALRDKYSQSCFGLRGKLYNVFFMSIENARRSPVIKELFSVLSSKNFKRIIIETDMDEDGKHIVLLVLGFFFRFYREYIEEGRVFIGKTPLFIFTKGKEVRYGDTEEDIPKEKGWKITRNKGLGGLEPREIERFIINKETRELRKVVIDEHAEESLIFAMRGAQEWIGEDQTKNKKEVD